ncbi:carbohydrate ABC transporter permease [Mesorhizobium sp. BR1-1-16]|uniref:carbohydrate ABC transporter permease n=1 Tax=Mesorhizobium sp. BR1-1-16 TaxID=2876653 RepID=UPI001CCBA6B1|nr:carbohydrate ABC transporter permease [Mesorhizobium sp. BR1-1-16]MBZ9935192.1 carbohydrate ABC transporter permease [Mesorhizobium sp. BR1-1-16]
MADVLDGAGPGAKPTTLFTTVTLVVLGLLALAVVFPFIWMLFTSLKPESEIATFPPQLLPHRWTFENYENVWTRIPFARLFLNSILFAGGVTIVSLLLDSMAAYALARLQFRGRNVIFVLILVALMLPFQVMFVPLFVTVHDLHMLDSYSGLIVPRATNAFGIFMLRQFFVTLPKELDEAARIDGCGEFGIYWRIILPLSGPAIATLAVFHFMYNWNDFLWPLLITSSMEMRTLPAGLALFVGSHVVEYGVVMAGAVLALLPLLVAFVFAQRTFIQGIAMSGIKG